jgi:tetratricopeptide (TPR) repeat protein
LNTDSRLQQLQKLLEEDPNDSFLLFAIAKEHEKKGNNEEAISRYEFIVEKDPEYLGTYYHLAKMYELEEESEKAIAVYKDGIAKCKKAGDMHSMAELTTAMVNFEMDLD